MDLEWTPWEAWRPGRRLIEVRETEGVALWNNFLDIFLTQGWTFLFSSNKPKAVVYENIAFLNIAPHKTVFISRCVVYVENPPKIYNKKKSY